MSLITISKRNKIIVSIVATILIFVGYYLSVYNSFSYQSNNDITGNVMMIISISLFPMLWLNIGKNSKWEKFATIAPMVIISIFLIIVMISKKNEYLEDELNKYGTNTIGKVTGFEIETHKSSKTDYATFKYEFENKQFIQRIENYDNEYELNQNLNIKISKINPEMFKIIETKK